LAVLQALTARASGSHTARAIATLYLRNHDFSQAEVETQLELLKREGLVVDQQPELTTEITWSVSLKGVKTEARKGRRLTGIGLLAWLLLPCCLLTSCTINPFVVTTKSGVQYTSLGGSLLSKSTKESGSITRIDGTELKYSRTGKDDTRVPIAAGQVGLAKAGLNAGSDMVSKLVP
jgi:hypothetical protein